METVFSGEKIELFELNKAIQRNIKRKEKYLDRVCGKMWKFTNLLGESFVFANFNRNKDKLIVTIAYWNKNVRMWLSCY
jgi:hypothetical protein